MYYSSECFSYVYASSVFVNFIYRDLNSEVCLDFSNFCPKKFVYPFNYVKPT